MKNRLYDYFQKSTAQTNHRKSNQFSLIFLQNEEFWVKSHSCFGQISLSSKSCNLQGSCQQKFKVLSFAVLISNKMCQKTRDFGVFRTISVIFAFLNFRTIWRLSNRVIDFGYFCIAFRLSLTRLNGVFPHNLVVFVFQNGNNSVHTTWNATAATKKDTTTTKVNSEKFS